MYMQMYVTNWTEFSGRWFESHSGQLLIATSKNPSVVNTIDTISFFYTM